MNIFLFIQIQSMDSFPFNAVLTNADNSTTTNKYSVFFLSIDNINK